MASKTDMTAARERRRKHLDAAVRTLRTEPGFRAWLEARKLFHHYSSMNVLWIVTQCPQATHVAGFRAWRDRLGYQVRKGEKGIAITVPLKRRVRDDEDRDDDDRARRVIGFGVGHVFDRSQVDPIPGRARPLENPTPPAPVEGDTHSHLLDPLLALAREIGFGVYRAPLDGGKLGACNSGLHRILIAHGQSPNAEVRVLVHELAHALGVGYAEFGRCRAEAIVDCVAYLVCAGQGLDVEGSSVPYIAGWADDDSVALEGDAFLIDRLAGRIERALRIADASPEAEAA